MKRAIIFGIFATLFNSLSLADETLSFDNFPVKTFFQGTPEKVDLTSHASARQYRTALREGAKNGPNFSGHYTIVMWGCGTACQGFAIVNAENGKVYFSPKVKLNAYQAVHDLTEPFQFKLESSLLVLAGTENDNEKPGFYYYHWNEKELVFLKYVSSTFEPK